MDYKKKIEYAEKVASSLLNDISPDIIKSELKDEGLYERDITNIFVSARKIMGEQFSPQIRAYLLADKEIHTADEFKKLDKDTLDMLIEMERKVLQSEERKKISAMIKEGNEPTEIINNTDLRFISPESAIEQIKTQTELKKQNSGSGRLLNIVGGIGLIVITVVVLLTTDRLFYFLPILGIIMIFRGLTTQTSDYDD